LINLAASKGDKEKGNFKPVIGLTLVSLVLCGFFYPFLVTGIGQVFFPYQANGEIVQLNGEPIGSELIAQTFTSPLFFHPRSDSASGVDPHITLDDAYSQVIVISNATGISESALKSVVDQNQEGVFWVFGSPYLNVLRMNLVLMNAYPTVYGEFLG
jgi:K+-transporting ATPase ATPase C chain